jgi:uncharacterized protein
MTEKER